MRTRRIVPVLALLWIVAALPARAQEPTPQPVGLATYYQCDPSMEARADTIVTETFAPVFDRLLSEGKIVSWMWLAHQIGGKWRRLGGFYASDMTALMEARAELLEEIQQNHPDEAAEFSSICHSHDDYVWRTIVSKSQ
jgi:hypothetical protein